MSNKDDLLNDDGEVVIKGAQYESQLVCLYKYCSWMVEDYSKDHGVEYCCIRLGQKFFVTPFTNFTFTSIDYQLYLDLLFHRGQIARLGHYICMPMICFFFFAATAQWSLCPDTDCYAPGSNLSLDISTPRPWVSVALIFYILAFFWYVFWGLRCGHFALSCMAIPLGGVYVLATLWIITFGEQDFNARKWYSPTTSNATNPWIWMWIASFCQSTSHFAEQNLPPRVSGDAHWVSIIVRRERGFSSCWEFIKYVSLLTFQFIAGTVDEWLAAFRLLPLFWLKLYFETKIACWKKDYYWNLIQAVANVAIASGDPGIDQIDFTVDKADVTGDFYLAVYNFKKAVNDYKKHLSEFSHFKCVEKYEKDRLKFMQSIVDQLLRMKPPKDDDNIFYGDQLPLLRTVKSEKPIRIVCNSGFGSGLTPRNRKPTNQPTEKDSLIGLDLKDLKESSPQEI